MITVKDVRERLKLTPNDESPVQPLIDAVVALWEDGTRRLWARRVNYVKTVKVENPATDLFFRLPLFPVESATFREWGLPPLGSGVDGIITVPTGDYFVTPESGRVQRTRTVPFLDYQECTITGGYTPATAPADVRLALQVQLQYMWRRYANEAIILKSQGYEKGSTSYLDADWHPFFKSMMNKYSVD